ncbi:MAG: glucan biosynthesis protein [Leptospiraceae bacterium]|nr:glucan biosynthesis protein [Leptospiraceae bacterium]
MGVVNLIMGIVAAVLIATGIKKEEPVNPQEKRTKVEILEKHKIVERSFDYEELRKKAKELLSKPYKEPKKTITKSLAELNYDKYKDIRFLPEKSIWREEGSPFQLQFLHPGYIYDYNVLINEVKNSKSFPIYYNSSYFDFSAIQLKEKNSNEIGFSGFKVHYPINTDEHTDEFLVFQGATYFRAVSQNQFYGLSARGLATNTGMPYAEDFPIFKEFWIKKPASKDESIKIYALMDGKSAVGAYEFEFIPGKITETRVKAEIILRKEVDRLGIAPLTSMYWYGENSEASHPSAYPEIHDSDGLLVLNANDEWIWRPLENPKKPTLNSFSSENVRGFGLLQRDREFSSYEDSEMKYHLRPGAWVEPEGDWGKGSVQLYRSPTKQDSDDNIGAFWVPDEMPKVGEALNLSYKIFWVNQNPNSKTIADVVATRVKPVPKETDSYIYQIDFKGGKLKGVENPSDLEAVVTATESAGVSEITVQKIPETEKWRCSFKLTHKANSKPVELKAFLKKSDSVITESWTYTLEL